MSTSDQISPAILSAAITPTWFCMMLWNLCIEHSWVDKVTVLPNLMYLLDTTDAQFSALSSSGMSSPIWKGLACIQVFIPIKPEPNLIPPVQLADQYGNMSYSFCLIGTKTRTRIASFWIRLDTLWSDHLEPILDLFPCTVCVHVLLPIHQKNPCSEFSHLRILKSQKHCCIWCININNNCTAAPVMV